MTDNFQLLDIKQAAKFLNVSETSLRRWTNSGRLPCLRLGPKKVRRFRREDLLAFTVEEKSQLRETRDADRRAVTPHDCHADGTHICSLYANDQGKAKLSNDFLHDGMKENCVCFLIAHKDSVQETANFLKGTRPEYRKEVDDGRLRISEYLSSGPPQIKMMEAALGAARKNGALKFRVVGNVSEGKIALQNSMDHLMQYERNYDATIAKKFPVSTLCQYDARHYTGVDVAGILKCHADNFRYPLDRIIP